MPFDDLHRWIAPLGWTLVHFVWQGVAVTLAAWALITLARGPRVRYAIGCVAMVAMLACPIATLAWIGSDAPTIAVNSTVAPRLAGELARRPDDAAERRASSPAKPTHSLRDRIAHATPALVAIWLVGVSILAVRHLVGVAQLIRLRRGATAIVEPLWRDRIGVLSIRLDVRRRVALLLTDRFDCPAVVGAIRPAILWPLAAMTGLTPSQIEALLAHELAHVRRHDYAINLLQTLVETLLFYHPAVWWISRRVRQEREHCCDDLAASVVGDRATYAGALAAMESLRQSPAFALSAGGGSLLHRVRRLLAPTSSPSPIAGRGTIAAMLLVTLALVVWSARAEPTTRTTTLELVGGDAIDERVTVFADDDPAIANDLVRLARLSTPVRPEVQVKPERPTVRSIADSRSIIRSRLVERADALRRSPELWNAGSAGEAQRTKQAIADLQRSLDASPPPLGNDRVRLENELNAKRDYLKMLFAAVGEYYIAGHVQRTGVYSLTARHITLSQALSSAGIDAKPNEETWIDVVAREGGLDEVMLRFAWSDVVAGRHDDFYLLPNDMVMVGVNFQLPATQPATTQAAAHVWTEQEIAAREPFFAKLLGVRDDLKVQLDQLRLLRGENNPAVLNLKEQLASIESRSNTIGQQLRKAMDDDVPEEAAIQRRNEQLLREQAARQAEATTRNSSPLSELRDMRSQRKELLDALDAATRDHGGSSDDALAVRGMLSRLDQQIAEATGLVGDYYISGVVGKPGVYSLTGRRITLMQAITSAESPMPAVPDDDPAHDFGIDVVRREPATGKETRTRYQWSDVTHGKLATFYLMPDDQIFVGVGGSATTVPATTKTASE